MLIWIWNVLIKYYWDSNSKVSQWQVSDSDGLIWFSEDVSYLSSHCHSHRKISNWWFNSSHDTLLCQSRVMSALRPLQLARRSSHFGLFFLSHCRGLKNEWNFPFSFLVVPVCWNCWMFGRDFNVNDWFFFHSHRAWGLSFSDRHLELTLEVFPAWLTCSSDSQPDDPWLWLKHVILLPLDEQLAHSASVCHQSWPRPLSFLMFKLKWRQTGLKRLWLGLKLSSEMCKLSSRKVISISFMIILSPSDWLLSCAAVRLLLLGQPILDIIIIQKLGLQESNVEIDY